MNIVNKKILEKELFFEENLILKYYIEYPYIVSSPFENGSNKFNYYNKKIAYKLKDKIEKELYKEAIEMYKYNKENGYPIMVYEVNKKFELTFNNYNIISLYMDEYIYSGGAHGNTIRTSQTWDLFEEIMVPLEKFFKNNPYFMINILKEINVQISVNPEVYFDNTCNLVLETFNPKNYYLIPNNIIIYFQQYDIAPYSSGIRTFFINYRF